MSTTLKVNEKVTLKNSEGKIIQIENKGQSNHFLTKGKFGELPSYKKFPTAEIALEKANAIISKKLAKGYKLDEETKIPGEYLEKGENYWKCLVSGCEVKVQSGLLNKVPDTNIHKYKTSEEAQQKAKFLLRQQIARGFIRKPEKFTEDFDDLKGTVLLDPLQSLNMHCKNEVSEDEDEPSAAPINPKSFLRRSNMVEIEEKDFPKETALKLSTMNMYQVIEEEQENGLVKSFIFEKPEIESDKTSMLTEVIEDDLQEIEENEDLPKKRKNRSDKYGTIQDMLHSIGLGRYVLNFETRKISVDEFLDMDEIKLAELGIPKRPREKILESKLSGSWEPVLTNSLIVVNNEETKVKQKKSLNPDVKIDPNFKVEQGASKPPDKIEVLLAQTWDDSIDPAGWWLSEKLDGVRCYWSGTRFYSRNGNQFLAPPFFTEKLPKTVSLDGELWMGRKMFQQCVGIIKRQDFKKYDMNEWAKIVYIVFDAPSIKKKFEDRLHYIYNLSEKIQSPYMRAHEHRKCKGMQDLLDELEKVEELGGEGIMLRQANSFYEHRRSNSLLKVKTFLDAEATVIGHKNGTGRCAGMMGALFVRADNGIEFKIGSGFNDDQRRKPPKIGSRVTYKYQELSNAGKPRFPIFLRVHHGV